MKAGASALEVHTAFGVSSSMSFCVLKDYKPGGAIEKAVKTELGALVIRAKAKRFSMFPDMDCVLLRVAVTMRCVLFPVNRDSLVLKATLTVESLYDRPGLSDSDVRHYEGF